MKLLIITVFLSISTLAQHFTLVLLLCCVCSSHLPLLTPNHEKLVYYIILEISHRFSSNSCVVFTLLSPALLSIITVLFSFLEAITPPSFESSDWFQPKSLNIPKSSSLYYSMLGLAPGVFLR